MHTEYFRKHPVILFASLIFYGVATTFLFVYQYVRLSMHQIENFYHSIYVARLEITRQAFRNLSGLEYLPIIDHTAVHYYLAVFGRVFGISEAWQMHFWSQIAMACTLLIFYPALMYRLTKSFSVATMTPVLINVFVGAFFFRLISDGYWAYAWVVVFGTPFCAILIQEKWDVKKHWYLLLLAFLIMSIGNVFRAHASLPLALLLSVILISKLDFNNCSGFRLLKRVRPFMKQNVTVFFAIFLLFISYNFLAGTLPRVFAPTLIGHPTLTQTVGPWHTLFLGLGWENNPFGIIYGDWFAYQRAREIYPDIVLLTKEYFEIMRTEFFRVLREEPLFFLGSYLRKFGVIILYSFAGLFINTGITLIWGSLAELRVIYSHLTYLGLLNDPLAVIRIGLDILRDFLTGNTSVFDPVMLFLTSVCYLLLLLYIIANRRVVIRNVLGQFRPMVLCCLFFVFAGTVPGMIATPRLDYIMGAIAAYGMLFFTIAVIAIKNIASRYGQSQSIHDPVQ